jgi:transposase
MQTVTTIGLDIAKSVFQVHGVDAGGQVVIGAANIRPPRHRRAGAWAVVSGH